MTALSDGSPEDPRAEPSLIRNTVLASVMFVGRAVLAFATTTLVARGLGVVGRGRIVYVSNLAGLLALIASAGTMAAINRLHHGDGSASSTARTGLDGPAAVVGLGFGIAAAALYWVVAAAQGSVRSIGVVASVLVVVATVALVVSANLNQLASLDNRIGAVTWTALVGVALYAAFTIVTVATDSATVANNVMAWAITSVVPVLLLIWPARAVRLAGDRGPSLRPQTKRLAILSLRANVAGTAVLAIWRLDVVIVEARRGYRELGLYSIAVALAEVVLVLAMAIRSALLPHHHLESAELGSIVARVTRIALAATTALALGVGVVGHLVLSRVFGTAYAGAYPALAVLLPGTVFLVLHYPLFDYIAARGGSGGLRSLTIMGVTALVINAGGNIVLLRWFDYTAAAAVSTFTYAIVFVWCCVLFRKHSNVGYGDLLVLRRGDLRPQVASSVPPTELELP